MKKRKVITKVLGPVETNVYLVGSTETGKCVVVDPADDAGEIISCIEENGFKPEALLLTHGHSDHFMAAEDLKKKYGIPLCALDREKETLSDPEFNTSESILGFPAAAKANRFFRDGDVLHFAGTDWNVIATPGHTIGGCCYYLPEEGILFSGDTLFRGSYGRTDFPGGDAGKLISRC